MASVAKVDKFQTVSGTTYNNVVNVSTYSTYLSNVGFSNVSLGTSGAWNTNPTSTSGIELLSFNYQPKFSNSKLLIQSSTFNISESSNVADAFRVSCFGGTTFLGFNYFSPYNSAFNGGYGTTMGGSRVFLVADSWGTDSRTFSVRVESSGSTGSYYYINYSYGGTAWQQSPLSLTITEMQV